MFWMPLPLQNNPSKHLFEAATGSKSLFPQKERILCPSSPALSPPCPLISLSLSLSSFLFCFLLLVILLLLLLPSFSSSSSSSSSFYFYTSCFGRSIQQRENVLAPFSPQPHNQLSPSPLRHFRASTPRHGHPISWTLPAVTKGDKSC